MPKSDSTSVADQVAAYPVRALVLQGGGALGAYQAGVYEGLAAAGIELNQLAGISIGALNVAIIAGNPPARRVERLHEFWDTICQPAVGWLPDGAFEQSLIESNDLARRFLGAMHAGSALVVGQRGFFRPRFPPAALSADLAPDAVSHYDTRPLRETLEKLCDFDRINDGGLHVAVGAVNVRTGNFAWFDNHKLRLAPEHFMASGALPPAFPPIEIDGEYYWDGGLVSNTPLAKVLRERPERDTLVFQVDLWSARGPLPRNVSEIGDRVQDIRYSSRTRMVTDAMHSRHRLQRLLREVLNQVPAKVRDSDAACREAAGLACSACSNIVHLIYRDKPWEQHFRDFQFGPAAMHEHWVTGLTDIQHTLAHPKYFAMPDNAAGYVTHDVHRDEIEAGMEAGR